MFDRKPLNKVIKKVDGKITKSDKNDPLLPFLKNLSIILKHGMQHDKYMLDAILEDITKQIHKSSSSSNNNSSSTKQLDEESIKFLETLSQDIMNLYTPKLHWMYDYAKNKDGEISHEVITEWQKKTPKDVDEKNSAFRDFKGDYRILDKVYKTSTTSKSAAQIDSDIEQQIKRLVAQTSESSIDKAAIAEWLKQLGGQECNFFITDLLIQGELGESLAPGDATTALANWKTVNNHVQLELIMEFNNVSRLTNSENLDYIITVDENGFTNDKTNPFPEVQQKNKCPILRVTTKIRLDVENGKVTPKVVELKMYSFSDVLQTPAHKAKVALKK